MSEDSRRLGMEVAVTTIVLVAITSVLNAFSHFAFIDKIYPLIFALVFLYVPSYILQKRGRQIDFLDGNFKGYLRSFFVFIIASLIVFPLFLIAAHFWMVIIFNARAPHFHLFPGFWKLVLSQLIMTALPEEFFFRGYFQSTLNRIFPKRWRIFGADLGWAWPITAAIFALAHSFVSIQWWHFAIFFPALLFGYLRERTGSITAAVLFHATSNIVMALIQNAYG